MLKNYYFDFSHHMSVMYQKCLYVCKLKLYIFIITYSLSPRILIINLNIISVIRNTFFTISCVVAILSDMS